MSSGSFKSNIANKLFTNILYACVYTGFGIE